MANNMASDQVRHPFFGTRPVVRREAATASRPARIKILTVTGSTVWVWARDVKAVA